MKTKYLTIIFFLAYLRVFSQIPVSLEIAQQKANENNLSVKAGQLKIDYQQKIKNSAVTIDPLNITGEIGQMNSAYVDNAVSIQQTLRLPKFYKNQTQVLVEEWKNAQLSLEVQKSYLKRDLAKVYNTLNYLDEKQKLLEKTDSIYSKYHQRAELRLRAGESNILEKITAENYRSQAEIQLQNLMKDREVSLYQFNYLINPDSAVFLDICATTYLFDDVIEANDSNCIVTLTLGVIESSADNKLFSVHPNPTNSLLNFGVELDNEQDVNIQIFDLSGRLMRDDYVQGVPAGKNKIEMNYAELAEGTYFFVLNAGDKKYNGRFVIIK